MQFMFVRKAARLPLQRLCGIPMAVVTFDVNIVYICSCYTKLRLDWLYSIQQSPIFQFTPWKHFRPFQMACLKNGLRVCTRLIINLWLVFFENLILFLVYLINRISKQTNYLVVPLSIITFVIFSFFSLHR